MINAFAVKVLFVLSLLVPVAVFAAVADPVVVIVNSENSIVSVTPSYLRKLYNNELLKWPNGVPVTLYDLSADDPVRELFSEVVLGKSSHKVTEQWAQLKITNQAKNPPFIMKSQPLVINRVSLEKGAVGYVLLSSVKNNSSVRIVTTLQ